MNELLATVERWFRAAVDAVDPGAAVERALAFDGRVLDYGEGKIVVGGRVWIVAVGKAAVPMARAAVRILGALVAGGVVLTKDGHGDGKPWSPLEFLEAAHPVPDARGVAATRRVLDLLRGAEANDLVLALISGGGSALLEAPVPPVRLADMAGVTDFLLRAGAPIQDLNAVRRPLSQVKGGGLLRAAPKSTFLTLALSDVLGSDPNVIASGPTVAGSRDPFAAFGVLERYRLVGSVPPAIEQVLRAATERQSDAVQSAGGPFVIVGDNEVALRAIAAAVAAEGLRPTVRWWNRSGEARDLGAAWVDECQAADPDTDVVLGGGEATVTVVGSGIGGRNTEFALAAAIELDRRGETAWAVASLATDGQDGTTGVAGAIADGGTVGRSRARGVDPGGALAENDSLAVFRVAGGTIEPGPTGTNVNDLYLGIRLDALSRSGSVGEE